MNEISDDLQKTLKYGTTRLNRIYMICWTWNKN